MCVSFHLHSFELRLGCCGVYYIGESEGWREERRWCEVGKSLAEVELLGPMHLTDARVLVYEGKEEKSFPVRSAHGVYIVYVTQRSD